MPVASIPKRVRKRECHWGVGERMVKRVGVIGGGQLAWMTAGAAERLGLELVVQTPSQTDPAVAIAADAIFAPIDDASATAQLAAQCDVITFENEFVDLDALSLLANQGVCFRPSLDALRPLLDKYHQRAYLQRLGLPTPKFAPVPDDPTSTTATVPSQGQTNIEFPRVLKTRRHGYDGQGTFIIQTAGEWEDVLQTLGDRPLLLEEFVPFERELAVMAARSLQGEVVVYPVVETQQENQVCRRVFAPAGIAPAIVAKVETIAQTLLTHLDVVGIFGIELFLTAEGRVLVNEVAPRTHNSGHLTLDACETSQFEQQLRAVAGLSLGSPTMKSAAAVMVNLLGYEHSNSRYLDKRQQLSEIPNAVVHWYGKTESRPGRKLGHVTVLLENHPQREIAVATAQAIEAIWYNAD